MRALVNVTMYLMKIVKQLTITNCLVLSVVLSVPQLI